MYCMLCQSCDDDANNNNNNRGQAKSCGPSSSDLAGHPHHNGVAQTRPRKQRRILKDYCSSPCTSYCRSIMSNFWKTIRWFELPLRVDPGSWVISQTRAKRPQRTSPRHRYTTKFLWRLRISVLKEYSEWLNAHLANLLKLPGFIDINLVEVEEAAKPTVILCLGARRWERDTSVGKYPRHLAISTYQLAIVCGQSAKIQTPKTGN